MKSNYDVRKSLLQKTNWKKPSKKKKNRKKKTFAVEFIKKKGDNFSIILIWLFLQTINYSGKRINYSFETREIKDHKLEIC